MADSRIVIAVTGGIAAFKAAALTSRLAQSGYEVQAIVSPAAEKFIGKPTFAALTNRPVATDLFDPAYPLGAHIELARWTDLFCVVPATANFIANAAQGRADDLISTTYLCCTSPVIIAPAMNCEMWEKKSVQRNIAQLKEDGVHIVDPQTGWLSCRTQGVGRMAEPDTIFEAIEAQLS